MDLIIFPYIIGMAITALVVVYRLHITYNPDWSVLDIVLAAIFWPIFWILSAWVLWGKYKWWRKSQQMNSYKVRK